MVEVNNNLLNFDPQYIPGVCNIGPEEIQIRKDGRKINIIIFMISIIISIVIAFLGTIDLRWILLIVLPAGNVGISHLQVTNKFCVYFGTRAIFNFNIKSDRKNFSDPNAHSKDLRKVRIMILKSAIFGIVFTLLFYFSLAFLFQ